MDRKECFVHLGGGGCTRERYSFVKSVYPKIEIVFNKKAWKCLSLLYFLVHLCLSPDRFPFSHIIINIYLVDDNSLLYSTLPDLKEKKNLGFFFFPTIYSLLQPPNITFFKEKYSIPFFHTSS